MAFEYSAAGLCVKRIPFLLLLLLFFVSSAFSLFDMQKTDSCFKISSSGTYQLTNDIISSSSTDSCILIASSNVNLDCDNKTIINSQKNTLGSGILISDVQNVSVKNCNIRGYSFIGSAALAIYKSQLVFIDKGSSFDNYFGISSSNSKQLFIINHNAHNIHNNFYFANVEDGSIRNSLSNGAETGIYILDSNSIVLSQNSIFYALKGISLFNSKQTEINQNEIYNNGNGIVSGTSETTLLSNDIFNNSATGLILSSSSKSSTSYDSIYDNGKGIELLSSKITLNRDKLRNLNRDIYVLGLPGSSSNINGNFSYFAHSPDQDSISFGISDDSEEEYNIKIIELLNSSSNYDSIGNLSVEFNSSDQFYLDLFEIFSKSVSSPKVLMRSDGDNWNEISIMGSDQIGFSVKSNSKYGIFKTNFENLKIPLVSIQSSCNSTNFTITDEKGIGINNLEIANHATQSTFALTNKNGFATILFCGYVTLSTNPPLTYYLSCICPADNINSNSSCPNPFDPSCPSPKNNYVISGPYSMPFGSTVSLRLINNTKVCRSCFLRITSPDQSFALSKASEDGSYSFLALMEGTYAIDLLSENQTINPNARILQSYTIEVQKQQSDFYPYIVLIFVIGFVLIIFITLKNRKQLKS